LQWAYAVATAGTIVSASTASTKEARKTAVATDPICATLVVVMPRPAILLWGELKILMEERFSCGSLTGRRAKSPGEN